MRFCFQWKILHLILLLQFYTGCCKAEQLSDFSFKGPYDAVNEQDGKRTLGPTWTVGNAAVVKQHFVRLTPDRQGKRGFVWSAQPMGTDEFAAVVAFRISGQAKRWFGDGIGIWITQHQNYVYGVNHGFTDKFVGVGIILDTFVNTDQKGGHKDVSLFLNDGSRNIDAFNEAPKLGCDAALRYHEKDARFNPVYSASRLKIQIKQNVLTLSVDATSSGQWEACYEGPIDLPAGWLKTATLGFTAATGDLADNHDLLHVTSFDQGNDPALSSADSDAMLHTLSKDYDKWIDAESCGPECKISILQKKIQDFQVDFEHKVTDLQEKTSNTIKKLKAKESANHDKIEDLEKTVKSMVDKSMGRRMNGVTRMVGRKIERQVKKSVESNSGSWKTPFFFLITLFCGGTFVLYRKYQHLRKSHLL